MERDWFGIYGGFAPVYDLFMEDAPYREWGSFLAGVLAKEGIRDGLVLELGCGTGRMTRILAEAGYDMIGLDLSEEMLCIAKAKEPEGSRILYLNQDMRSFELYGTVRAVVSVCDSLNYLMEEADLRAVFRLVNNYLDPGGIFVFDLNTLYKYREILGQETFCENREEASYIWENNYDEAERVNEYDLTLFVREEDGRYRKYEETHLQRGYSLEQVRELAEASGMEWVGCYDAYSDREPGEESDRVTVILRERGKRAADFQNSLK